MTSPAIMADLETWGTAAGCDLRSIGGCLFDPVAGTVEASDYYFPGEIVQSCSHPHSFYRATDNPRGYWGSGSANMRFFTDDRPWCRRKYPLTRDPETVAWWSEQSAEAQAAFEEPVDLAAALRAFGDWLGEIGGYAYEAGNPKFRAPLRFTLWAHGPHFDVSILEAAYAACNLPTPWHHRAPRDTRTCFDLAGIDDHSAWPEAHPGPMGVPHHALDDAICQARAVCAAYSRMNPA